MTETAEEFAAKQTPIEPDIRAVIDANRPALYSNFEAAMTETVSDDLITRLRDHLTLKWMASPSKITGEECQLITVSTLAETVSALSAMKAERDAARQQIVDALYSPGTVRTEPLAELLDATLTMYRIVDRCKSAAEAENAALKSDLTRYIDIATKEATEAESLREALAQSDADATAARIAIDRLTSERDALIASTGEHITKRSEYLARAERAEAERDALAKALEPFAKAADVKLCGHFEDHQYFGQTDVGFYLTFGDLRRARSTLQGDAK